MSIFEKSLQQHLEAFGRLAATEHDVAKAASICADAIAKGKKVIFCGNGGSAADSQHIAAELVGRLVDDRRALPALSLTTDTSALTCIANDYGYDHVFARQLSGVGQAGDVLIAISTSGNSANILNAVETAKSMDIQSIGWLGKDGGKLAQQVDLPLIAPSNITARIQEIHIFWGHVICALIEKQLGYGNWESA
ncbi:MULTISPECIES: SIS domain-containing protein [Janthinobacterium]|uniref:D-sedoheptulose-7-phosphate isomerase n=1 Tax=Janthinobacterium TaxID=29580 RepID=UPI001C5B316C|nr:MULTISPECIES: SIS domain-containing protein [Janthinobacterium]MBW3508469.1 SIS domain-containing protein [Janthinobacterium sp. NKUCC06_STL]MCA1861387.1 SIS domain-containing protein [Janthinobacterium lividum]